jgi:hypothetical protein
MEQRYSGVHRNREGILQDGKSGEFFPDIFSFESNAGTRRPGLVLEIIVFHPHVPGRGSRPVRLDGCNDLRVLLPAERDHVQGGTTQRCNTSQANLGIVERNELGALFDPACGSDSILCVVAQDLFDRRIVRKRGNRLPSACHEDFQRSRPTHSEDVACLGPSDVSRESAEEGQDSRRIAPGHPVADRL